MTVTDDGVGFDPAAPVAAADDGYRRGMGLRGMQERAAAAGLRLQVVCVPGVGTRREAA